MSAQILEWPIEPINQEMMSQPRLTRALQASKDHLNFLKRFDGTPDQITNEIGYQEGLKDAIRIVTGRII